MNIYIINLISIFFYSFFYNLLKNKSYDKKKVKKIFVLLFTGQLFLILALRDTSIGTDVSSYITQFHYISNSSLPEVLSLRYEVGYKFLVKFITLFTENHQVFLSIVSVLSIFPIGRFIYKHSKMPFLSFAIYISFNFYAFVFSGLRQA